MTERDEFERWCSNRHLLYAPNSPMGQQAWEAWQAATARSAARIEELEREVMKLGDRADACVYDTLNRVCEYCRCKRRTALGGE